MRLAQQLTCSEIVELVTDYLEGALPVADRERFEEHIAFCHECLTYFEQMRETIATVGRVGVADELSPELQENLLRAFRGWEGS
jgi:anti-sigma factor RsiW